MPIGTETSTSSDGTTTTVGATVRDGGPGGLPRYVDVYLHITSSRHTQYGSPTPTPTENDVDRLSVWWRDMLLPAGGSISVSYDIRRRSGDAYEGPAEGLLVVCDRGAAMTMVVHRFCVCPTTSSTLPALKLDLSKLSFAEVHYSKVSSAKLKKTKSSSKKTGKRVAKRKTARRRKKSGR